MQDSVDINWAKFKYLNFQLNEEESYNFNPGTMGSSANNVINGMYNFLKECRNPLEIYIEGRSKLREIRSSANLLWPNLNYELAIGGSTTYWCNKLSDSFEKLWKNNNFSNPIRIISSTHEHKGALLNFENNPSFKVLKIDDRNLNNEEIFKKILIEFNPHLALFSQKTWDSNSTLPVHYYFRAVKDSCPNAIRILDSAQCIGIDNIEFNCSEIIVCSGHKWLFGPQGSGFMWVHKSSIEKIPKFHFGEIIDSESRVSIFEESGGQNFMLYTGILESLKLYKSIGVQQVNKRSLFLAKYFFDNLEKSFLRKFFKITINGSVVLLDWINPKENLPYDFYQILHNNRIYCKFIKKPCGDKLMNRLRFGIPYYENKANLDHVINMMLLLFEKIFKND